MKTRRMLVGILVMLILVFVSTMPAFAISSYNPGPEQYGNPSHPHGHHYTRQTHQERAYSYYGKSDMYYHYKYTVYNEVDDRGNVIRSGVNTTTEMESHQWDGKYEYWYTDYTDNNNGTHTVRVHYREYCNLCGDYMGEYINTYTESHTFGTDDKCSRCGVWQPYHHSRHHR